MPLFLAGLVLFFAAHAAVSLRLVQGRMPAMAHKGLIALVSLAGIVLVVLGWGDAAAAGSAWNPPAWTRHVTLAAMPFALIMVSAAYAPTGRIKLALKHPMLAGVKLWAAAHLAANGEWRAIALFGAFLAYGVFARIAAKRRGDAGATGTPTLMGDVAAIAAGLVGYAAIAFYLHPILFGVRVVG